MRIWLLAFLLLMSPPPPLSLRLTPAITIAPASIRVLLRVERHPENRAVCLGYEPTGDDGMARHTCWELQGDTAPLLTQVTFTDVQAGTYEVQASLCRGYWDSGPNTCSSGWVRSVGHPLVVMGHGQTKHK